MRRSSSRSTLRWLAGMTASLVVASLFSLTPAAAETAYTLVFTVQPADNVVPGIDGAAFNGKTPYVTVAAVSSSGQVNPSFREIVTLVAVENSSGATLLNNEVRAVNGVAVFSQLAVDRSARLQLRATSSAVAQSGWPLSNSFRMVDSKCGPGSACTASYFIGGTRVMDASFQNSTTEDAVLSAGADPVYPPTGDPALGCSTATFVDPFFHGPAVATSEEAFPGSSGGVVTMKMRIDKAWRKMQEDRGNPSYRICGAVQLAPGQPDPPTWNGSPVTHLATGEVVFLFPDCGSGISVFCMVSVKSTKSGDLLETFVTKTGIDPKHW